MIKRYTFLLSVLAFASVCWANPGEDSEEFYQEIPRALSENLTLWDRENRVANYLPGHFSGIKLYDPQFASQVRQHLQNFPESMDIRVGEHCEALVPVMNQFQAHYTRLGWHDFASEIERTIQRKDLSPLSALIILWRGLRDRGDSSPDEMDLFAHVRYGNIMRGLRMSGPFASTLKTFSHVISKEENDFDSLILNYFHMSYEIVNEAEDVLEKAFLIGITYPLLNQGKFGLSFWVGRYFEGVQLMACPDKPLKAHGIKLSPLGFAVHDYIHGQVDPTFKSLYAYLLDQMDNYVGRNGDARSALELYVPSVVKQHQVLKTYLQKIYGEFVRKVLPREGEEIYNRVMTGFFVAFHELPSIPSVFYAKHDLVEIIEAIANSTIQGLEDEDGWESPADPLHTSPLDGTSALSREAILKKVLPEFLKDNSIILPSSYYLTGQILPREAYLQQKISRTEIKSSPRFIDVSITLKTGQKKSYSFNTLYHKWQNMDDSLGFLKFAGVFIEKPDLSTVENPREVAQGVLSQVQNALKDVVSSFKEWAIRVATDPQPNNSESLADEYMHWHIDHTRGMEKSANDLLNANPSVDGAASITTGQA